MNEELKQDPSLMQAKKIAGILLIVWVVFRLSAQIMEFVCARAGFVEFAPANIAGIAALAIFALLIYNGSGTIAFLPLFGGVFMLVTCFSEDYFSLLKLDLYPEVRLYLMAYILASAAQVVIMILILVLCHRYFQTFNRISKELSAKPDEPRL